MTIATIIGFLKGKSTPWILVLIFASLLYFCNQRKRTIKADKKTLSKELKIAKRTIKALNWDNRIVSDSLDRLKIAKTISDTTIFNYQDSTIYTFKTIPKDSIIYNTIDTVIYDSVSGGMFLSLIHI